MGKAKFIRMQETFRAMTNAAEGSTQPDRKTFLKLVGEFDSAFLDWRSQMPEHVDRRHVIAHLGIIGPGAADSENALEFQRRIDDISSRGLKLVTTFVDPTTKTCSTLRGIFVRRK